MRPEKRVDIVLNNEPKDGLEKKQEKKNKGKITDEFEESMLEDMRGPMEGMEAVPTKK